MGYKAWVCLREHPCIVGGDIYWFDAKKKLKKDRDSETISSSSSNTLSEHTSSLVECILTQPHETQKKEKEKVQTMNDVLNFGTALPGQHIMYSSMFILWHKAETLSSLKNKSESETDKNTNAKVIKIYADNKKWKGQSSSSSSSSSSSAITIDGQVQAQSTSLDDLFLGLFRDHARNEANGLLRLMELSKNVDIIEEHRHLYVLTLS